MEVLDTSISSVALPHIAGSLSATNDEATWVLTSYLVANAVILPASSWFALKFGRRNFLLFCICVFTGASLLCGAAQSLGMILAARVLQGAGGGALQPLSQSILLESFPPAKRGAAMAVFGLGVVVAPVLGPTLGGWLTDNYSWRWAYYINIPVGLFAFAMIRKFVKDPPYITSAKPGKFDSIGLGLLAIWLGALQFVLDKGQEEDWFGSKWIRWGTAIAAVFLIAFLVREFKGRQPLVDLRVFVNRNFAAGCVIMLMFGGVVYGIIAILPLFYQTLLGYPASVAGIAVSPRGLGALMIMPVVAVLTSRMDNRYLIACGFGMFAWTSMWMAHMTLNISPWSLIWPVLLSGVATGMIFVPLSTVSMGTLTNQQIGNASGLYNLLRNTGGSVGISVVNSMVARHQQIHSNELGRYFSASRVHGAFGALHAAMARHTGPAIADLRTYAILNQQLQAQSTLYSYVDGFRFFALICMCCLPIVFLLRPAKAKAGAAPAVH
jgi:DHA2 family multidrug resistance protein